MNGDRRIAGIMKGYDQYMNVVLDEAIELVQKKNEQGKAGEMEQRPLGIVTIRGSSIKFWENIDKAH